jgi:RpiR family murPQ operon transcriptional repressor
MKKSALRFLIANKKGNLVLEYIYECYLAKKQLNINDISQKCFTSPSTITRFFKTSGFNGFNDFKYLLSNDENIEEQNFSQAKVLEEEIMINPILETAKLNDEALFEQAYQFILNSHRIFISCVGGNYAVGYELQTRLERFGFSASLSSDNHLMWVKICNAKPGDVLFAISYSGETPEIINIVEKAKSIGLKIVAITRYGKSKLTDKADLIFNVEPTENLIRILSFKSRTSMLYIVFRLAIHIYQSDEQKYNQILLDNIFTR